MNRTFFYSFLFLLSTFFFFASLSVAQSRTNIIQRVHDSRGKPELTVCSQNLENFGALKDMARRLGSVAKDDREEKVVHIVKRIQEAGCDVIAVQEVLGSKEEKAKDALKELTSMLQFRTNRRFVPYVGPSNDKLSRLGFLVAEEGIEFNGLTSLISVQLPKIAEEQEPRLFSRGPLELRLKVEGKDGAPTRQVILVTFHFKSQAFNSLDGADLSWETYRMEMAEALRRVVTRRHAEVIKGNGDILMLVGDRNSHFDSASAKILTGELVLRRFQGGAMCRLSKRGIPLCQEGAAIPPAFVSVLTSDPQTFRTPGTYLFEKTFSWLDDILVPVSNLPFLYADAGSEGDYDSGTLTTFEEASDHALVWARLNW